MLTIITPEDKVTAILESINDKIAPKLDKLIGRLPRLNQNQVHRKLDKIYNFSEKELPNELKGRFKLVIAIDGDGNVAFGWKEKEEKNNLSI